jgi:hypothetical protein
VTAVGKVEARHVVEAQALEVRSQAANPIDVGTEWVLRGDEDDGLPLACETCRHPLEVERLARLRRSERPHPRSAQQVGGIEVVGVRDPTR